MAATTGTRAYPKPIAIVELSFRLPGGVDSENSLWELLEKGDNICELRELINTAASSYTRSMASTARSHGFVRQMYALLAAMTPEERAAAARSVFGTRAWEVTRRGGPQQDLKVGFMPESDDGNLDADWDEGGFLVEGERSVYVHCGIRDDFTKFSISAPPAYMKEFVPALQWATEFISDLLVG
ncbi:hypothetical protein F5X97DRAFT_338914 [Nemania serpens]|nr:hypothetical protein F5X97DRAFT_338914 [Nemania serpens]